MYFAAPEVVDLAILLLLRQISERHVTPDCVRRPFYLNFSGRSRWHTVASGASSDPNPFPLL